MTKYLKTVDKVAKALADATQSRGKAFILVAVDDPKETTADNTVLAVCGGSSEVRMMLEVLLQTEELNSVMEQAMINVLEEQETFSINDLLNELK